MSGWQKKQEQLTFCFVGTSEACLDGAKETGPSVVERENESPARSRQKMMEEVVERENVNEAIKRVRANQGSPGVDGMSVDELPGYLEEHWPAIREQLMSGSYEPQPVKRVEIEKPDGGVRKLGVPTVVDRVIQQAVLQCLQRKWDPTFSESSYGFRPGRSQHQAVAQAQKYIAEGYGWCVDLDLEKFFDQVNHDKLMGRMAQREEDKRLLKLIRAMLKAGVMENGLVKSSEEGTPQGGPLSPLLSNLVLDELDRELEARGHRFVRYADDCNIYVRSERAGQRVMESVKRFITRKLKLKVNETKSAVAKPQERKFLGFSFYKDKAGEMKRRIAPKALEKFKDRVREITLGSRGRSMEQTVEDLNLYLRGWVGYFGFCQTPWELKDLDKWIRRRIRSAFWQQWKTGRKRYAELVKRGVAAPEAKSMAGSNKGSWHLSLSKAMSKALSNATLASFGLYSLSAGQKLN
jgi:RNA-directed DNA polymerase